VGRSRLPVLDEEVLTQSVQTVASLRGKYQLTRTPSEDLSYETLRAFVLRAVSTLKGDKSPGYPFNLRYATNREAMLAEGSRIVDLAILRLRLLLDPLFNFEEMVADPYLLVSRGLVDPLHMFVKGEPHPARKATDGRWRCISSISVVDNLVETVLFDEPAKVLRDRVFLNTTATGIGFTDRQNREFLESQEAFIKRYGVPIQSDQSGFDACHTLQTGLATCDIDALVYHKEGGLHNWNVANRRYILLSAYSVVQLDGILYVKAKPGMLNSGSKDTTRRNTLYQCLYSSYITISRKGQVYMTLANGDDGLTYTDLSTDEYMRSARKAGFSLRDVSRTLPLEFCSHRYLGDGRAELLSWKKGVYRVLTSEVMKPEDAMQFAHETRHNPEHERILAFLRLRFAEL